MDLAFQHCDIVPITHRLKKGNNAQWQKDTMFHHCERQLKGKEGWDQIERHYYNPFKKSIHASLVLNILAKLKTVNAYTFNNGD